jgi:acyl dehydratase
MPIDPAIATGTAYDDLNASWRHDDVILYHLGVGAGADPTDDRELEYVNERYLKVLPTYSVIPGFAGVRPALQGPGLDYHLAAMLHGEQELVVHAPLPPEASVITTPVVEAVFDKGNAAVIVLRADTRLAEDGSPLSTNRFRLFVRGEGGFGGDSGPTAEPWEPHGAPLLEMNVTTLPQQAAIYRLCGDRNPLHIDPKFAARAGFDRPILHGLCTYGITCKAIVDSLLDGDPRAVTSWACRFSGSVYPGESLVIQAWKDEDRFLVEAKVKERDVAALTHGVLRFS